MFGVNTTKELDRERVLFQRENIDFRVRPNVRNDGSIECRRCNISLIVKDWASHVLSEQHQRLYEEECELIATERTLWERRHEAAHLAPRVAALLRPTDQDKVNAHLLRYIMDVHEPLHVVENLLRRFEHSDRVVLLLLAIWKTACLSNKPNRPLVDVFDVVDFMTVGWKESKETMRSSNRLCIIGPLVIQYLDRPSSD